MAIVMRSVCDVCLAYNGAPDDVSSEAVTIVIGIGETSGALELCEEHRQSLLGPVETLLQAHGRDVRSQSPAVPPKASHKRRGRPPFRPQLPPSPTGTGTLTIYPGGEFAVIPEAQAGEEASTVCPICHFTSNSRQGLSGHVRGQHNTTVSELVIAGRLQGTSRTPRNADLLKCPDCGMTVRGPRGLNGHKRVHTGTSR